MNPSLHSFTPRVISLGYDSLALGTGCQDVPGDGYRGFRPIVRVCIAESTSTARSYFTKSQAGYCYGPGFAGDLLPFLTSYVAHVGASGVRIARLPLSAALTPTTGSQSTLFKTEKPTHLTICFSSIEQMVIAVAKNAEEIEIRRFYDALGHIASITFTGTHPLLVFVGQLYASEDDSLSDVVCLYLRPEKPKSLFARFQNDNWGTERELNFDLPINLANLQHAGITDDFRLLIYATDDLGREISLYSLPYAAHGDDKAASAYAFTSGFCFEAAVEDSQGEEELTLGLQWTGGYSYLTAVAVDAGDQGKLATTIAFTLGEYSAP